MKRERLDGLIFLLLGALAYLGIGLAWSRVSPIEMGDFKVVYYASRCLLQHGDPYSQHDVLAVYTAEGRESPTEPPLDRDVKSRFFYPPTAFILTVPIALGGYEAGKLIWMTLCSGSLILAAFAIWDAATEFASTLAGLLPGLLLAGSFWLFMIGNSAAIAVGFCIIATWCFYRERFVWAGVLSLALSLAMKPNDSGLVWLFFLLAGASFRKRALQSIAALAALSLPFILWVSSVSPHWTRELQANMASFSGTGGIVDPGITGMTGKNMDSLVQLQTAISVFSGTPRTYDLIAYAICLPVLLIWLYLTLKRRPAGKGIWLALAVAAPLSMLPTYHFQHDAKLILLTIPTCAVLWAKRGVVGWFALLITLAGILVTGDIFTALRIVLTRGIVIPQPGFGSHLVTLVFTRPAPLVLLAMAVFYLWIYARRRLTL